MLASPPPEPCVLQRPRLACWHAGWGCFGRRASDLGSSGGRGLRQQRAGPPWCSRLPASPARGPPPSLGAPHVTVPSGWLCPYAKRKLGRVLDTGRGPREHEDRDGVMLPQTKEPSVSRNPRRLGAVGWGREEPLRSLRASEGPAPPTPRPCACSPRKGGQIPAVQGAGRSASPQSPPSGNASERTRASAPAPD